MRLHERTALRARTLDGVRHGAVHHAEVVEPRDFLIPEAALSGSIVSNLPFQPFFYDPPHIRVGQAKLSAILLFQCLGHLLRRALPWYPEILRMLRVEFEGRNVGVIAVAMAMERLTAFVLLAQIPDRASQIRVIVAGIFPVEQLAQAVDPPSRATIADFEPLLGGLFGKRQGRGRAPISKPHLWFPATIDLRHHHARILGHDLRVAVKPMHAAVVLQEVVNGVERAAWAPAGQDQVGTDGFDRPLLRLHRGAIQAVLFREVRPADVYAS